MKPKCKKCNGTGYILGFREVTFEEVKHKCPDCAIDKIIKKNEINCKDCKYEPDWIDNLEDIIFRGLDDIIENGYLCKRNNYIRFVSMITKIKCYKRKWYKFWIKE